MHCIASDGVDDLDAAISRAIYSSVIMPNNERPGVIFPSQAAVGVQVKTALEKRLQGHLRARTLPNQDRQ